MISPRLLLQRLAPLFLLLPFAAAAQSFLQPTLVPTGNWPDAIYTADINGDGFPDLIYLDHGATQASSTAHVLLNDGRAHFTPSATLSTSGTTLAVADIDQDGHPDIAWIQYTSNPAGDVVSVTVARGNGDGTFQTPVLDAGTTIPHGPAAFTSLVAGHIAHSTLILDLAFVNTATPQLFLLQSGTALTTGTLGIIPIDGQTGPLALADLSADGYQDIILQQGTYGAQTFLSQPFPSAPRPYATFGPKPDFTITPGTGLHSLLIQDVNRDGRPDLIAEGTNGSIDVFPGNGDGNFDPTSIGGTGTLDGRTGNGGHLIATADLNRDGLLDALTVTPIGLSTLLGNGTAYLGLNGIYNAGPTGQSGHPSYATADFNNDGILDLAVDSPEGIAILFGNSDGSFQTSRAFAAGQPALSSATGVFTASAHPDVVVSTAATQAQFLSGVGDGTLLYLGAPTDPTPTTPQTGAPNLWSTVLAADLDNDGNLDLLLTADGPASVLPKTPDGMQIQLGDGTGHFAAPRAVPSFGAPTRNCPQAPGYFYGTSALGTSLLGTTFVNRDFVHSHYFLNGNHSFPGSGYSNTTVNGSSPCGPFSHNLTLEAVFTPRVPYTQSVTDTLVQGDGHIYLFTAYPGSDPYQHLLGDLSVDGSLTTPGQRTAPALFPLYGGFVSAANGGLDTTAVLGSLVAADLDRDGHQDLIALYANFAADPKAPTPAIPNYIYIWFGDGTGHFPVSAAHPVNPVRFSPSRNYHQAAVADLNRDSIPDLILTDGYLVSVQLGKGDGTFGPETHYLAGQGINSLSPVDLRGSGQTDLALANGGSYLANPAANRDLPIANGDVNTGGVTVLLNDAPIPALLPLSGSVVASPEPSTFGTAFSLTAFFNPPAGSPVVTGTVTFSVDGIVLGTATIYPPNHPGVDYPAPNTLPVGPHTITAAYSGDGIYAPATYSATHVVIAAAILGSISATPEPSAPGQPFTITATGFGAGRFDFSVDGTFIGSVTSTTTDASIAGPTTLASGTHSISVAWTATTSALARVATGTHVVTAPITGTISAAPEPSAPGQPFTITASGFAAGAYQFAIDSTPLGNVLSSSGTASIAGPTTLASGSHTISVGWIAADVSQTGSAAGTHIVTALTRSPTSLALVLCVDDPGSLFPCATPLAATPLKSPVTMYYGQILDGVATESSTLLTGTINFIDGTRVFCTINALLSSGMTTCPPDAGMFHAGSRIVTAAYSGDALNEPSTSNQIAVNVLSDLTTGLLTTSGSPALQGTPVTFTFVVSGNYAIPVGTVSFFDGTVPLGSATLDSKGSAQFTTATLAVGTHTINATYAGSADFTAIIAPVSLQQVITTPATTPTLSPTTVTLVPTGPTTIFFNQPAYSTYGVYVLSPTLHPASGTITVQDNGVNVAICTNIPNGASCPYAGGGNLSVGTHSITVLYNGDSFNAPAVSPAVVFTVLAATPVITLTSSINPALVGTPVTFTATFTGILGAGFAGSVDFLDGTTLVSTQTLSTSGVATFTTSTLAVGTHPITARFAGSTNFTAATSPVLNQVITAPAAPPPAAFTLTVTPNPVTLAVGSTGALLVTVTTPTGFTQPIALSCAGLPTQTTCTFVQPLLPATGAATTLQLAIAAPHNCGNSTPYFIGTNHSPFNHANAPTRAALCFFPATLLLTFGLTRNRRRLRAQALTLLLATVSALVLTTLTACGTCTDLGTRTGHYTFTVTATPQQTAGTSATAPATQPVNLTVNLP